jgi:integrase
MKKKRVIEKGISELESGVYLVDLTKPEDNDRRVRKKFKTQGEARHYKTWILSQWHQNPDWAPRKKKADKRRLSQFIDEWYKHKGKSLSDGKRQKAKLMIVCDMMNDPLVSDVSRSMFSEYRAERCEVVKPQTVNKEHGYFCSLFNSMIELGQWKFANPVSGIKKLKFSQPEMAYLEEEEVEDLLLELNRLDQEVALIAEVCLSTGARWREAQKLLQRQVKDGMVYFVKTKTCLNRRVNIDNFLYERLRDRGAGHLFRQKRCEKVFERAIQNTGIDLPEGQCTHVLRHTFATHYLANYPRADGVKKLQRILGHTNIKTTERYLNIVESRITNAETLNPVAVLRQKKKPHLRVI